MESAFGALSRIEAWESAETSFQSESSVNCFSSSVAVLVQNEGSTEVSERFYSYVSDVASAVKVRFP